MGFLPGAFAELTREFGKGLFEVTGGDYAWQRSLQGTREQQGWLERMANTAHQRQVLDLRAAGLNPILSVRGSGAATPSAAAASAQSSGGPVLSALGSFIPAMRGASALASQASSAKALRDEQGQTEFFKRVELSAAAENQREQADLADQTQRLRAVETESAKAQLEATQAISSFAKTRNLTEDQIEKSTFGRVLRWLARLNPFGSSARDFVGAAGGARSLAR